MRATSSRSLIRGPIFFALLLLLPVSCGRATDSLSVAQAAVDEKYRDQVFWIKGSGTPEKINTWSYYFYDPSVAGKARLVKVANGKLDTVGPAEFKTAPSESLVFDPAKIKITDTAALAAAKARAEKAKITYDRVKMQLRRTASGEAPSWRIELYEGARFAGTVYLKEDGTVARYDADHPAEPASADKFFKDVEGTFKGIGGDLEQFFTGERTVDQ